MINEVRKYFGFTQSLLSGYLGIGRTMLSMIELRERTLTPKQHEAFHTLIKLMIEPEETDLHAETIALLSSQENKNTAWLHQRRKFVEQRLTIVNQAMEKLFHVRENCLQTIRHIAQLSHHISDRQRSLIWLLREKQHKLLKRYSLQKLESLRAEAVGLAAELHYLNEIASKK